MVTVLFWKLAGLGLLVTPMYAVMVIEIAGTGVARIWQQKLHYTTLCMQQRKNHQIASKCFFLAISSMNMESD